MFRGQADGRRLDLLARAADEGRVGDRYKAGLYYVEEAQQQLDVLPRD